MHVVLCVYRCIFRNSEGEAAVKEKLREEAEYCRSVKLKIGLLTRPQTQPKLSSVRMTEYLNSESLN